MKTVYAPNTANAYIDAAREIALANPGVTFALVVFATGLFATWALKNL
jgi:hypothetical protein